MNKKQVIICIGMLLVGFVLGYLCRTGDRDRYFLIDGNNGKHFLVDKWDGRVWKWYPTDKDLGVFIGTIPIVNIEDQPPCEQKDGKN